MSRLAPLVVYAALLALSFIATPAKALNARSFVGAQGLDTNACTFNAPCRTFQRAHDATSQGGEIDVLNPAGYGPLTITKAISIQGHGFSGITQAVSGAVAITVQAGATDAIHLHGLLLEGGGTGLRGIQFDSGGSLDVVDCFIRHFGGDGVIIQPSAGTSYFVISNTGVSDNLISGINIHPLGGTAAGTIERTTTNHNNYGVYVSSEAAGGRVNVSVVNSVSSNNSTYGYAAVSSANLPSVWLSLDGVAFYSNGLRGLVTINGFANAFLGHSNASFNGIDVDCSGGGNIFGFGDNRLFFQPSGSACYQVTPLR